MLSDMVVQLAMCLMVATRHLRSTNLMSMTLYRGLITAQLSWHATVLEAASQDQLLDSLETSPWGLPSYTLDHANSSEPIENIPRQTVEILGLYIRMLFADCEWIENAAVPSNVKLLDGLFQLSVESDEVSRITLNRHQASPPVCEEKWRNKALDAEPPFASFLKPR